MDKSYSKKGPMEGMKPDKLCHGKSDMGTEAKKARLPGQMYTPKKEHNESDFVGEGKGK